MRLREEKSMLSISKAERFKEGGRGHTVFFIFLKEGSSAISKERFMMKEKRAQELQ